MGVYTQFGSISGLVESVIADGFRRLGQDLAAVPHTADPIADLVAMTWASIQFARAAPNLYQVMFGTIALGQYRRTTSTELTTGRPETLDRIISTCERAISGERFLPSTSDAVIVAHQWWCMVHGYNMLEIGGYIRPPAGEQKVLRPMLETILTGLGDTPEQIRRSLSVTFQREAVSWIR